MVTISTSSSDAGNILVRTLQTVSTNFFTIGNVLNGANMTWVTLVPKCDDAKEIRDYKHGG